MAAWTVASLVPTVGQQKSNTVLGIDTPRPKRDEFLTAY
jgi:hypothetical protein